MARTGFIDEIAVERAVKDIRRDVPITVDLTSVERAAVMVRIKAGPKGYGVRAERALQRLRVSDLP